MNLIINNLSITYPNGVQALSNIHMNIDPGMYGLLGPNGAGKSTLMRTIATLQRPDTGTIEWNGLDIQRNPLELRKVLGYLPQEFGVYHNVSAIKLLNYLALLKGLAHRNNRHDKIEEVLHLTNLYSVRNKAVHTFSGGMKQRFGIAQILLNNPKIIIVDEPTAGLDPEERRRFLNVLRGLGSKNIVIFSTHLVEDVKDLCSQMAVIKKGQVVLQDRPQQLIQQFAQKIWRSNIAESTLLTFQNQHTILSTGYTTDHKLSVRIYADHQPTADSIPVSPTLEDVYFYAMNHLD